MFRDPKTTFGGIVCILAVIGLLFHKIDLSACVTILGIAGGVIGFASKDSGAAPTYSTTVKTESLSNGGATAEAVQTSIETKTT